MSNLIGKLENNEAILMMYLAGELPLEERLEVDQMLQRDAALRSQYTYLRRALQRVADDFAIEVAHTPLPAAEAARQRLRPIMRQWAAERVARPRPQVRAHKAPWFLYPLVGTAAALVLVALILSQIEPAREVPGSGFAIAQMPDWQESTDGQLSSAAEELTPESRALLATLGDADPMNSFNTDGLTQASSELYQIRQLSDAMAQGTETDGTFLQ